ncbi:MAG TPA: ABC transporter permease [Firmicutes bacterium]|nr:ABC transporter permease [Bacillota bacterium]
MKLLALMKKEFARFFGDPKLLITMILPGVLIYLIYSIMGSAMFGGEAQKYDFKVYVSGESAVVDVIDASVAQNEGWTAEFVHLPAEGAATVEEARAAVESGEASALIVFSEDFDASVAQGAQGGASAQLVYNSEDEASAAFASLAGGILDGYGRSFAFTMTDFAESADFARTMMAGILPFLIVVFIFSSCMSVTLESVAGEKERGTLATILVTSARRTDIALGKVLPLSCVSLIGAASGFLGVVLSLPTLMGISVDAAVAGVGALGYFMLLLLIVSVVPLIVSAIATVSTLSRTVKEASSYTGILMILMMVLSIVAAFVSGIGDWAVAIPVLNAVVAMQGVLTGAMRVWQCLVSFGLNLVYTAVLVFVISRLLSSERIMFGK